MKKKGEIAVNISVVRMGTVLIIFAGIVVAWAGPSMFVDVGRFLARICLFCDSEIFLERGVRVRHRVFCYFLPQVINHGGSIYGQKCDGAIKLVPIKGFKLKPQVSDERRRAF